MNSKLLKSLESLFNDYPMLVAGPAPCSVVNDLEKHIGFELPLQYKDFVARFGGAIVGPYPVYGFGQAPAMSDADYSAIAVTDRFRKHGWEGVENWLVFSMDLSGSPIGLDASGSVWLSDHESDEIKKIADSFEGFIEYALSEISA